LPTPSSRAALSPRKRRSEGQQGSVEIGVLGNMEWKSHCCLNVLH
jgi:hypothetical protein